MLPISKRVLWLIYVRLFVILKRLDLVVLGKCTQVENLAPFLTGILWLRRIGEIYSTSQVIFYVETWSLDHKNKSYATFSPH